MNLILFVPYDNGWIPISSPWGKNNDQPYIFRPRIYLQKWVELVRWRRSRKERSWVQAGYC